MDPLTVGLIAGGVSAITGVGNSIAQGKMNKRAERFNREMYAQQRQDSLSDWNMQNSYNDPSAQMQRLKQAGLNPNLVYGNGATTESATPRGATVSQPNFKAPQLNMDVGSVAMQAMQMKQIQSNIARTDAETASIQEKTASTQFENSLNNAIGLDTMWKRYTDISDQIAIKFQKENLEFEAWKLGSIGANGLTKNSPAVKAMRAGYEMAEQQLKQAKIQEDISAAVKIVKDFEAGLAKQGISPNSPWWVKLVGDLIQSSGIKMPSIPSPKEFKNSVNSLF